ncbi:voltage-gated potassium channel [Aureococcus anophagefferens]|nr:voltage-gated potassium channel [Aureococcus anophagefferens]
MSLPRLVLACALAGASAVNHTLGYLPFSWDTLPRYTFCVNSSGPLNDEALAYVAKQPIFLNNPVLTRPAGSIDRSEWFYYAIDLVRVHNFENDHWMEAHPECQLRDVNGDAVPRTVWDFGSECGAERWLNTSRALVTAGKLNGVFIDGFQGCNPFEGDMGCVRREILGKNGTLICNYTPGPFTCDPSKPIAECPCDGTNDERGGGNFDHVASIAEIEATQGDYAMLTHVPHANDDHTLLKSMAQFLIAASDYQYHGSGFGYECGADGWLARSDAVERAYAAPSARPGFVTPTEKPSDLTAKNLEIMNVEKGDRPDLGPKSPTAASDVSAAQEAAKQMKHTEAGSWTIAPDKNKHVQNWDVVLCFALVYTAVVTPAEFFLHYQLPKEKGLTWVRNHKRIVAHYLKGYFCLDFFSSIPFGALGMMFPAMGGPGGGAAPAAAPPREAPADHAVYVISLYFAIMTLTTVGYGDVLAQNISEYALMIVMMFLGGFMWAYIIGAVCAITSTLDIKKIEHQQLYDQINNMLVDLAITRPVAASVRSFLFQTEEMERRIGYSDLIEFLSPELQGVLCEEISAKRLTAIKYFQHRSSNFRLALFKRMTRRLFCPQELIYEDRLLIIANQGVIGSDGRIYTSGMALNLDFFLVGELRLVLMMRALNYVEVERLAKENLFEILRDFPEERMPVMWARVFSALIRKVKQMKVQHKRPSRLARGPSTTSLLFNTGDLVECYQAVSSDPHKLKDVSDAMKDTQPLCEIAVGEDAAAFQYASPRLRADAHFVDYAVLHAGPDAWKTAVLPHVEEPLKTLLTRISASAKVFYENDPGAAGSLCAC